MRRTPHDLVIVEGNVGLKRGVTPVTIPPMASSPSRTWSRPLRIGVLWRGDPAQPVPAREATRLREIFGELAELGAEAEPVVFADQVAEQVRSQAPRTRLRTRLGGPDHGRGQPFRSFLQPDGWSKLLLEREEQATTFCARRLASRRS